MRTILGPRYAREGSRKKIAKFPWHDGPRKLTYTYFSPLPHPVGNIPTTQNKNDIIYESKISQSNPYRLFCT